MGSWSLSPWITTRSLYCSFKTEIKRSAACLPVCFKREKCFGSFYYSSSIQTILLPYSRYWKTSLSLFSSRNNKQCMAFTHTFSYISQTHLQLEQTHVIHYSQWIITAGRRQLTAGTLPLSFFSPPRVALEAMWEMLLVPDGGRLDLWVAAWMRALLASFSATRNKPVLGAAIKVSGFFVITTEQSLILTSKPTFWTKGEFSGKFCRHYMSFFPNYNLHNSFSELFHET